MTRKDNVNYSVRDISITFVFYSSSKAIESTSLWKSRAITERFERIRISMQQRKLRRTIIILIDFLKDE